MVSPGERPPVPLNDPGRLIASMGDALPATAARVIRSGRYILGSEVAAFEEAFARYLGARHAVGVANGTDALEIALRACGVLAGDGVLMCANAGMYAAVAAQAIGAVPVFADIDASGLLNTETLEEAIGHAGAPPRAVVVTHLYGRVGDIDAILAWARRHRLRVVEDCAQAHGARIGSRMAGAFGDAAAFSFYPTKNLGALGDGGMVVSGEAEIDARARALREYGWTRRYHAQVAGGRNSRLDELQAALLLQLLPGLDARNARRRAIALRYSREIGHPLIETPTIDDERHVAHLYVVRSARRDALATHLARSGIATAIHYPLPDHRQPVIAAQPPGVSLPMSEAACAQVLTLPCFPELDDGECAAVVAACNAWAPG